jgi:hypothetical protein
MTSHFPHLPSYPAKTGPGHKWSGPVSALGLKVGGVLTTLAVFAASFGYASGNVFVTNAPLKPATVAAVATTASTPSTSTATATSTTTVPTTTLTRGVRTTTRAAVTRTASS